MYCRVITTNHPLSSAARPLILPYTKIGFSTKVSLCPKFDRHSKTNRVKNYLSRKKTHFFVPKSNFCRKESVGRVSVDCRPTVGHMPSFNLILERHHKNYCGILSKQLIRTSFICAFQKIVVTLRGFWCGLFIRVRYRSVRHKKTNL